jgi:RNA polymerase sigma factor (sigma-70 family)
VIAPIPGVDLLLVCIAEAQRIVTRYGWQLVPQDELGRRAATNIRIGRSTEPRRAVIGAYCEVLYTACTGIEGNERQNRAYQELGTYLYSVVCIRHAFLPHDLREDIVQDALMRIHQSLSRCKQPIAFFTFAAFHLLDAVRAAQRRQRHDVPLNQTAQEDEAFSNTIPDPGPTPEEHAIARARRSAIEQLLAEYSRRHHRARKQIEVLRKTYIEELDDSTIAIQLSMSVGGVQTARSRIKHALGKDQQFRERARHLGLLDD